jgi:acetylornithine deacetylase/succinyl-diaminopimelate desuccinylase-like protein
VKGIGSLIVGAGGSDLRLFVNEGMTSAVMYGPDSGNGHANDEWVDLSSLFDCIKILCGTIIDFCEIV